MDKITEASLLYDFYGQLLTERKRQVMELYHEENLSLAEIAEEFMKSGEALRKIEDMIGELTEEYRDNRQLIESLETIKSIIRGLEEV